MERVIGGDIGLDIGEMAVGDVGRGGFGEPAEFRQLPSSKRPTVRSAAPSSMASLASWASSEAAASSGRTTCPRSGSRAIRLSPTSRVNA